MPSKWKNTMVLLFAEYENGCGCFTALGAIGKRAEKVADEAVDELLDYASSSGCVDPYLADQLLLPLSIVQGKSQFSTSRISQHLLTNIAIIQHFLDVKIQVNGQLNEQGIIEIANEK